jgi:hypothetical protein
MIKEAIIGVKVLLKPQILSPNATSISCSGEKSGKEEVI